MSQLPSSQMKAGEGQNPDEPNWSYHSVGQDWCHFSKLQEKASADIPYTSCTKEKGARECQKLDKNPGGFPYHVRCDENNPKAACELRAVGYMKDQKQLANKIM
ncbi:hypothetical protein OAM67_01015 [bacterium]|nr:hypothetical protein [bacterium]